MLEGEFFQIRFGPEAGDAWLPGDLFVDDEEIDCRVFTYCQPQEVVGREVRVATNVESSTVLPITFGIFDVPYVDEHVADILRDVAVDDVELVEVSTDIGETYFILNAIRCVDCIDDERSTSSRWPLDSPIVDLRGEYQSIYDLKIDTSRVGGCSVFRTKGWTVALIISRAVAERLTGHQLYGTRLIRVD